MPFGFEVFGKAIGMSKGATENLIKANKDVLGRDLGVSTARSGKGNMLSNIHQNEMVKNVHNWAGIDRAASGKDVVTAGQIANMGSSYRGALKESYDFAKGQMTFADDADKLKLEKAMAGFQRDKYMSYAGEGLAYGRRFLQHTFMEGSAMDRAKKVALYGGTSMTAGTGLRMAQGAGMTYNSSGERDIAGIPFI